MAKNKNLIKQFTTIIFNSNALAPLKVKIPESRWLTFFISAKRPKEALSVI